ncbi:MAG TPA: hypothetical protein VJB95_00405 [Candidatus Paceibacterota bacterium]
MDSNAKHYYGDVTRIIFFIAGVIMATTYPFFKSFISAPMWLALTGCIVLAVFGGLMNPRWKWVIILGAMISVVAFPFFEYSAVHAYLNLPPSEPRHVWFFWTNQFLSILFFFSAYLSTKSVRGAFMKED